MKKLALLILFILLFSNLAYSLGKIIELEDFSINPEQKVTLNENDALRINLLGSHVIVIDEIHKETVDLDVFVNEKDIFYAKVREGLFTRIDLSKDFDPDLEVSIRSMDFDSKIVTLILSNLKYDNPERDDFIGEVVKEVEKVKPNFIIGLIVLVVIVLMGLLVFVIFKS